jgi:hypothetical protein
MTLRVAPYLSLLLLSACLPRVTPANTQGDDAVTSPDARIVVRFRLSEAGEPRYRAAGGTGHGGRLGLVRDDANWHAPPARGSAAAAVTGYEIPTAKRRQNVYRANRQVFHLETADGKRMNVVFRSPTTRRLPACVPGPGPSSGGWRR